MFSVINTAFGEYKVKTFRNEYIVQAFSPIEAMEIVRGGINE